MAGNPNIAAEGRKATTWRPGHSGNPSGRPFTVPIVLPDIEAFESTPLESRIKSLKELAATLAYVTGHTIYQQCVHPRGKIDREKAALFKTAFDAASGGVEQGEVIIRIPACLQASLRVLVEAHTQPCSNNPTYDIIENISHNEESPTAIGTLEVIHSESES